MIGEDKNLAQRLAAIDRLVDPLGSPQMLAKCIGLAGQPLTWLPSATSSLVESNEPQNWEQALEEYERLAQDADDALIPILNSSWANRASATPSMQARRLAHERLARLPASLLQAYRKRVDAPAKKLLQQGQTQRDPAPLRKLVDDMFCSSHGEEALDLLGDLAFERGQFAEAHHWWSLLIEPDAPQTPAHHLHFPAATIDPALVRAKQILTRIFRGQTAEASQELKAFRASHGHARGTLAGRAGVLADILADVLRRVRPHRDDSSWTTFGGDVTRQHVLAETLPMRLWADGPTWRQRLPAEESTVALPRIGHRRQPAFHPIIVEDQLLLGDSRSVRSHHLQTGKLLWQYDLQGARLAEADPAELKHAAELSPSYTLSACDDRLFVRLGKQVLRQAEKGDKGLDSYLVCLDLHHPCQGERELWHYAVHSPWVFEGAPLAVQDRVFIAQTKVDGPRTQTAIACFDARSGRRRWLEPVCDATEIESSETPRARHHLLTLAGGQLVYCSHSGAIVAVDPWSGRRLWGLAYPSRGRYLADGSLSPRDLAPCVVHGERLYVAPLDSDHLFCLDPASGAILWERPVEVVHLLGVAGNRLVFTTPAGLMAVNARTGSDTGGWQQPAVGKLPGLGRGLLMSDSILWPTQDVLLPLRLVSMKDGSQETADGQLHDPTQLRSLVPGNMIYANGCLVVAGTEELVVYSARARGNFPSN